MGLGNLLAGNYGERVGRAVGSWGSCFMVALKLSRPAAAIHDQRGLSSSSTSATNPHEPTLDIREPPCLMLFSDDIKHKQSTYHYFSLMNIATKEVLRLRRDDRTIWFGEDLSPNRSQCVGSSKGWLAYVNRENGAFYLLNPLVEQTPLIFPFAPLPPLPTTISSTSSISCSEYYCTPHKLSHYAYFVKKVALSCSPFGFQCDGSSKNIIPSAIRTAFVMMIHGLDFGPQGTTQLSYCTAGSESSEFWSGVGVPLPSSTSHICYEDVVFSQTLRIFLVLTSSGMVMGCYFCLGPRWRTITRCEQPPSPHIPHHHLRRYLVEAFGTCKPEASNLNKLLQVLRYFGPKRTSIAFQVFELSHDRTRWVPLANLGEYSLFLGRNESLSVSGDDVPGIQTNCIYYTNDDPPNNNTIANTGATRSGEEDSRDNDVGVFDLNTGKCTPLLDTSIIQNKAEVLISSPPVWIYPSTQKEY